ncbi:MAG: hypothetical protein LBM73_00260, partial [Candidatus Nomurabacteria bacterium]|nr:hypothetical protein [Candidatus Nomurabacteria bacterium]
MANVMEVWLPLAALALVQSSFGLSVSLLTLMSGHTLGRKASQLRLVGLSLCYVLGACLTVSALTLAAGTLVNLSHLAGQSWAWPVVAILLAIDGLAISLFYYRGGAGTRLWLPRRTAKWLAERAKKTRYGFEAFLLAVGSIVTEMLFILAPIVAGALLLTGQTAGWQTVGRLGYSLIVTLPLLSLAILIAGGHRVSALQKWRETNKRFLQIAAGILLIILAIYL